AWNAISVFPAVGGPEMTTIGMSGPLISSTKDSVIGPLPRKSCDTGRWGIVLCVFRRAVSLLAGNTGRRAAGPRPTDGGGFFQGEWPLTRNEFGLSEHLHVQALQTRPGFDPEFPRQVGV